MPFIEDEKVNAPLGLPEGFDLNPDEAEAPEGSVLGAAFRMENPIVSGLTGYVQDQSKPFDPEYRVWDDIQGTKYEGYADRFHNARDVEDVGQIKAHIDREMEDRAVLDAAGFGGWVAEMAAGLLSPTSLLPGGAVYKGAKGGISIGKSALMTGAATGAAVSIDELFLQQSQQTRTGEESAIAIGGSVILGSMLGAGAAKLSKRQYVRTVEAVEAMPEIVREFDDSLRSIGAADTGKDMDLRREKVFQAINKVPLLRGIVRSDPMLRAMLSDNVEVRRGLADLAETVLQYKENEFGRPVTSGPSVESAIKTRRNTELAQAFSAMAKAFGEYAKDGPVGTVGRITAPITVRTQNLLRSKKKLTSTEFSQEVGKAMRREDQHPIPQVAQAAADLRKFFDGALADAIEVGLFDEGMKVKHAASYFSRIYNTELIKKNLRSGNDQDIAVVMRENMQLKRRAAEDRLANDRTVTNLENDRFTANETMREARNSLKKATEKARGKRDRAKAAVSREGKVGRVTEALRKAFQDRSEGLADRVMDKDVLAVFKDMVKDARGLTRLEPPDILKAIRELGGIKDPRFKNRWKNGDWVSDGTRTDIENILDNRAVSIRRNDGMELDYMREALVELGYLPEGSTEADLLDAISRSAGGEKVYSQLEDGAEIARYEAAQDFAAAMDELGIDLAQPIDKIIAKLPDMARNQPVQKAKAGEAARSAKKAGKSRSKAEDSAYKAMDRLEEAQNRLKELKDEVGPKVRDEIKAAREDLKKILPELKKAKAAQSADEYFAGLDDLEIEAVIDDTVNSLLGMKPGEHSIGTVMSKPSRARALDIADELLEPWLESDAGVVMSQYFNNIIPDIELTRKFGDIQMSGPLQKIVDEKDRLVRKAKTEKERVRHQDEAENRIRELQAMRDRIRGVYGVPEDPKSHMVRAGRALRTASYMGYLGGMTLSAMPDVAGVIGRGGVEAAFGSLTAVTDPKRMGLAIKDAQELGAAAEWWLNSRAMSISEVMDANGANTRMERGMGAAAQGFGYATGMIPWNAAWKSVGGAFISSRMSKAAMAVKNGKATKKQLLTLSANGIDSAMAQRIAKQIEQHADMNGQTWLPQAGKWTDQEAFEAFRNAMNREIDIMIVTPGQDKPLLFSSEAGKFFSQFKSFAVSSHHRILLAGMQRADAEVLAQFTTAVALGMFVAKTKAYVGGYEQKEGAALWEDAIDRAGLAGWLFEAHGLANGFTGGRLSLSGEETSRFQSRSTFEGLLGPSVDMGAGIFEGVSAISRGDSTYRDVKKIMRPLPGNNIPYLMGGFRQVEDALVDMTGSKPRN